ncbi:MAG: PorP/SprF family type IX secretion system membrane protein [Cytophagaceae bacterium]|nr:PorP/SprF family type IX secretion system membrane protein [Cytophagaceae bacterium]MBP6092776.1 PorP/SprF family type IX secretion system membrane protein [Cytophagaceae bacterium]
MQGFKHVLGYFFMFLLMISSNVGLNAQQMPGLSLYHLNSLYYNPAAAGAGRDAYVQVQYRNQWTSYETSQDGNGNLGTSIVGVSLPLNFQHLGMGLVVMNDKTPSGVGQQVIRLQVAYHYPLSNGAQFSLGLGFGMQSKSFDGRIFRVRDVNDPLAVELSGKQVSQAVPDFNAGVLYTSDLVEMGLGISHLNQSAYDFGSPTLKLKNELAANMHVKANLPLNDRFEWSPFAQLNFYNGVLLPQLGAKVIFQQQFWAGGGYRWNDAATVMAGVSFLNNRLDLAYAMDLSVINSNVKSNLSHEVMLRFVLPSFQTATRFVPIKTPRFN